MRNGFIVQYRKPEVICPRPSVLLACLVSFVFCTGFLDYCSPVAVIEADPLEGGVPLTVRFDAGGSTDKDDDIARYIWDFGDGSEPAEGVAVEHVYSRVGDFTATLTVIDAGDHSSQATVTVRTHVISLSISTPHAGASIDKPDVIVKGKVSNLYGYETGVMVNGKTAHVYGGEFVVNHVMLQPGDFTITAQAVDVQGNTAQTAVSLTATTPEKFLSLSSGDEMGSAPLASDLLIYTSLPCHDHSITVSGAGPVEYLPGSGGINHRARMSAPGLYYFTALAHDKDNNQYSDEIGILVLDAQQIDTLLRTKWDSMREALARNNTESAVKDFCARAKNSYGNMYHALTPEQRAEFAEMIKDIKLIKIKGNTIEYDIQTTIKGRNLSFILLFFRDVDGLWKIRGF